MRWNSFLSKRFGDIFTSLSIESFAQEYKPFEKAKNIVRYLYYFLAFQSLAMLKGLERNFPNEENFSPIWSIAWADFLNFNDTVNIVRFFFLVSAFIGAFFYRHRIGRIIVFLGIFQLHAFLSSFVSPDHNWYPWLYVSFLLIFLPDTRQKEKPLFKERKKFLLVFLSLQAAIFFIYTMAGVSKVYNAINQFLAGEVHAFAREAFALHIAHWLSATDSTSLLGPFIIQHPWIGWPFFIGSIYLQFFALWIIFKPSLHKLWAFGLILIHIGTYVTMDILFLSSSIFLLFLFFDSPFRKPNITWREITLDLPLFGWAFRYLYKKL
ncbi:hypothetical protein IIA95_03075 [Patescibacteria group bacterium]|nr:hypothetical protein [Patescibacteria group bacterium]